MLHSSDAVGLGEVPLDDRLDGEVERVVEGTQRVGEILVQWMLA